MHRRVRQFRVRCAHEEHARHGRVLLEDALRTATLSDSDRLVLVRRLDLGQLSARASATEWSRRVEQTFQRARVVPVRFDDPAVAAADAVFFPHRHDPWLALAERLVARTDVGAWFWPLAVPGWRADQPVAESLRLCFRALAQQGGLALTLRLAARLQPRDGLTTLLRALQPADIGSLAPALASPSESRASLPSPLPLPPPSGSTLAPSAPPLASSALALLSAWAPHDLRTRWLAATALHLAAPSRAGLITPARIQEQLDRWAPHARVSPPAPSAAPASPLASVSPGRVPLPRPVAPHSEAPPAPSTLDISRHATLAGGLFFLIPLLARAGLPALCATLADDEKAALPWAILQLALRHARISGDDALVLALRECPPSARRPARWLLAAHRLSLRLARLPLRALITRPARVSLSPTHVDVFFRPGDADPRIRRAALDLDPGWVPWLGRIVAYHYDGDAA